MICLFIASEPRREFLSYCLSLMRSHSNEHADSLPVLDISALKHVAYVLDALIYYMRSDTINTPIQSSSVNAFNDIDSESWVADQVRLNESVFFVRLYTFRSLLTYYLAICFMKDENENDENDEEMSQSALDNDSVMEQDTVFCSSTIAASANTGKGRKNIFFQRSDSTLCLGCSPPDPFETPMIQSLPLADQPHLLQPNSRKEDLFGFPKHSSVTGT